MPEIRRLPQDVVNRIAAGEVLVRPAQAVKELIENSLDAGATRIAVAALEGGLKLLQVTDNGCGISPADFPLLCERFATSKLAEFKDLQGIKTFGFRGEALASLSYVSQVQITSARQNCLPITCAFLSGKPVGSPRPDAAFNGPGTAITAENLFFNLPVRRQTLKRNTAELYVQIVRVVQAFALLHPGRAFSCRRLDAKECSIDVASPQEGPISAKLQDLSLERIKPLISAFYGSCTAAALSEVAGAAESPEVAYFVVYGTPEKLTRAVFTLFVNRRLVDNAAIRRTLEESLSPAGKAGKTFVFLALEVPPGQIDCNVHPTKGLVSLLREEAIAEFLSGAICRSAAAPRVYTITPRGSTNTFSQELTPSQSAPRLYTITRSRQEPSPSQSSPAPKKKAATRIRESASQTLQRFLGETAWEKYLVPIATDGCPTKRPRPRCAVSRRVIADRSKNAASPDFHAMVRKSAWVGWVRHGTIAVQCGDALYLMRLDIIVKESVIAEVLSNLGGMRVCSLEPPLAVRGKASSPALLRQLFGVRLEDGFITEIPLCVASREPACCCYVPDAKSFEPLVKCLSNEVDCDDRERLIRTISTALGESYARIPKTSDSSDIAQYILLPYVQRCPHDFAIPASVQEEAMREVTSLRALYRVFERC